MNIYNSQFPAEVAVLFKEINRKLSLIITLLIVTGLFLSLTTMTTTSAQVAQLTPPLTPIPVPTEQVFGTDANGQQHEMPLKATHDLATNAVTNVEGFTITEQNVIPLERNGEFVVTHQPPLQQGQQIISVTFTTIDGQNTVQLQQIGQGRYSLQNIQEGQDATFS